jgi:hypothetical protein
MLKEVVEELNEKKYKLIDYTGAPVTSFDFHGNEYSVIEVLKDAVIAVGPDGVEKEFHLDEIMDQNDDILAIR